MTTITEPLPSKSYQRHPTSVPNILVTSHIMHHWRRSHIQPPSLRRLFRVIAKRHQQPRSTAFTLHDDITKRIGVFLVFPHKVVCFLPSRTRPVWLESATLHHPSSSWSVVPLTVYLEMHLAPAIIEDFEVLQSRPKVYEEPPKRVFGKALAETVFIPMEEH